MIDDRKYLGRVVSDQKFFEYQRELDIMTGLSRTDHDLISALVSYIQALEESPDILVKDPEAEFENLAFRYYQPLVEARKELAKVQDLDASSSAAGDDKSEPEKSKQEGEQLPVDISLSSEDHDPTLFNPATNPRYGTSQQLCFCRV